MSDGVSTSSSSASGPGPGGGIGTNASIGGNDAFFKLFVPGLIVGLLVGLFAGAILPVRFAGLFERQPQAVKLTPEELARQIQALPPDAKAQLEKSAQQSQDERGTGAAAGEPAAVEEGAVDSESAGQTPAQEPEQGAASEADEEGGTPKR